MSDSRSTSAPEVSGRDLSVVYRDRTVLDVSCIDIPAGSTYALLGSSGAGKSTLLRVLGMLERPSTGTVTFDGVTLDPGSLSTRRRIAAVFQKPHLMRGTVGQNVEYGLKLRRTPHAERRVRVDAVLARMGMTGWEQRSALTLSGGEQQRVALARALVLEPDLLLLDEPLSYLDPLLRRQLSIEFRELLANEGLTTLYVTHDRDEAVLVADRLGIMRDGSIVAEGPAEEVLALPTDEWVAEFLDAELASVGEVDGKSDAGATVTCGSISLTVGGDFEPGAQVLFGVRPEDVMIAQAEDHLVTSSVNRVPAVVRDVRPIGAVVRVTLDARELRLSSSVSRSRAKLLGLAPGMPVVAEFAPNSVVARSA